MLHKWAERDSNPRPSHYEWPALTAELPARTLNKVQHITSYMDNKPTLPKDCIFVTRHNQESQ